VALRLRTAGLATVVERELSTSGVLLVAVLLVLVGAACGPGSDGGGGPGY
jgi:hypothetical protein